MSRCETTPAEPQDPPEEIEEPEFCGLLLPNNGSPLDDCLAALGLDVLQGYLDSCMFDVGEMFDNITIAHEMACDMLETVVDVCISRGITVTTLWRAAADCRKFIAGYFTM